MIQEAIRDILPEEYPPLLNEIPEPPERLRLWGTPPNLENKFLGVIGARKFSSYGKEACHSIVSGLSGYPITIVSGLALGIDSIAHRSALGANLQTIAIPGSGLNPSVLHPRSHVSLAKDIVESGGGLMSEYDDTMPAGAWAFPRRNRIMAGMCHAVLVIESEIRSGTLITSRLATDYNRDVGAVPGPITSTLSDGPHMLLRLGATLVRDSKDVLEMLGWNDVRGKLNIEEGDLTDEEEIFIKLLTQPRGRDELIRMSKLDTSTASATLSLLEIKGLIVEELGEVRKTF